MTTFGTTLVISLLIVFLINFWHRTRGEREAAAIKRADRKKAEELEKKQNEENTKTCSNGWHRFTKWEDSSYRDDIQHRVCRDCGLKDSRRFSTEY